MSTTSTQNIELIKVVTNWTTISLPYVQVASIGGEVSIRQHSLGPDSNVTWSIPITYYVDNDEPRTFLLDDEEITIHVGKIPQKILLNQNGVSSYRVLYSSQLLIGMKDA